MAGNPQIIIGIVDDDPLFRETLAANLNDVGYQVRQWAGGHDFLTALADPGTGPLHLILLDWKMPGLSGIDVLRQLRRQNIALPVIFLTVLSEQIFEEAALQGGSR